METLTRTFPNPRTTNEYSCGFFFVDNEVVLIQTNKPEWQRGRLNGVGSLIENGETALEAMVRGFEKEVGLHVPADRWQLFCVLTDNDWKVYFFRAYGFEEDRGKIYSTTAEEVSWFDVNQLPSNCLANIHWMIPLARSPVSSNKVDQLANDEEILKLVEVELQDLLSKYKLPTDGGF